MEMDMESKLMAFFNKQPRIGVLSTADKEGGVNAAVFGSPRMIDDDTIVMGTSANRTLQNLEQNPSAVYLIVEQGKAATDWRGLRVYLKVDRIEKEGNHLEQIRSAIAKMAGEDAAGRIVAAVVFKVTRVRPLVDFGQGWETTI
jgi:hypothetical protein